MNIVPAGLYILGFGGHARSVADIAVAMGFGQLAFVDDNAQPGEAFAGFPVLRHMPADPAPGWLVFPAVGDNVRRRALSDKQALELARLIAPTASIGLAAVISGGVLVAHHAHVGPGARIGRGAILNTGAIVDHETQVGAFTHISINAAVAGRCTIGANVMIGAGAVVIDGISIAEDVIIGSGATVVADIAHAGTYVGTPARLMAHR
jgi:sugar O-acyltransferase (sialic acid O-acetyltransferase NeuD family)